MRSLFLYFTVAMSAGAGAFLACGTTYADPEDDARTDASADGPPVEAGAIPAGAVMFFDLATCPDGWAELATAQGRVLVGRTPTGLLGGTVGTPLSDQAERRIDRVPAHAHLIDAPVGTTADAGAHAHTATTAAVGAHTHSGTTAIGGSHSHNIDTGNGGGTESIAQFAGTESDGPITDFQTSTTGNHTHAFTTEAAGAHSHGVTVAAAGAHGHSLDLDPFMSSPSGDASVDVTMPYLQLLACRKT
jgi:hypothetical protein